MAAKGSPSGCRWPSGNWVVWEAGKESRGLGTPNLREVLDSLGVVLDPPAGPLPDKAVDFYNGLTGAQTAALKAQGYDVPGKLAGADTQDGADSFYRALIAAAGDSLRGVDGGPTPDRVHQMVVDEFATDIARPNPLYRHLISGDRTSEQVLSNLQQPAAGTARPFGSCRTWRLAGSVSSSGSWAGAARSCR